MPVTMKDIAIAAGVSQQAVSQALNRKGRLRPETRRRLTELADRMGYRSNSSARAIRLGRFGTYALLQSVHSEASTLARRALLGIHEAIDRIDHQLAVERLPDER
ncbi:MAG: LacI family DNA-binding transcriptional regulator, partial [Planctomycetota bacterium]